MKGDYTNRLIKNESCIWKTVWCTNNISRCVTQGDVTVQRGRGPTLPHLVLRGHLSEALFFSLLSSHPGPYLYQLFIWPGAFRTRSPNWVCPLWTKWAPRFHQLELVMALKYLPQYKTTGTMQVQVTNFRMFS